MNQQQLLTVEPSPPQRKVGMEGLKLRSSSGLESSRLPSVLAENTTQEPGIAVGTRVFLRQCPHGQPGVVLRLERNRAVVLWPDLDFLARHRPESLTVAKGRP